MEIECHLGIALRESIQDLPLCSGTYETCCLSHCQNVEAKLKLHQYSSIPDDVLWGRFEMWVSIDSIAVSLFTNSWIEKQHCYLVLRLKHMYGSWSRWKFGVEFFSSIAFQCLAQFLHQTECLRKHVHDKRHPPPPPPSFGKCRKFLVRQKMNKFPSKALARSEWWIATEWHVQNINRLIFRTHRAGDIWEKFQVFQPKN